MLWVQPKKKKKSSLIRHKYLVPQWLCEGGGGGWQRKSMGLADRRLTRISLTSDVSAPRFPRVSLGYHLKNWLLGLNEMVSAVILGPVLINEVGSF